MKGISNISCQEQRLSDHFPPEWDAGKISHSIELNMEKDL